MLYSVQPLFYDSPSLVEFSVFSSNFSFAYKHLLLYFAFVIMFSCYLCVLYRIDVICNRFITCI